MPEREALFDYLTGRQFVVANAELHGLADPGAAAQRAIALIEMSEAQDRVISTYSKGMRQRIKMASALVHDPSVLLLDEPFNGMDPRQRIHLMELLRAMGAEGRTVLFSSHILEEVEQVARQIEVVVAGRHAASGDFGAIRRLMTDRPNRFVLRTSDDRTMAAALLADPSVRGARLRADGGIEVEASDFGRFSEVLPRLARDHGDPAARGQSHRRVAGERLRLPGVGMISPDDRAARRAQRLRSLARGAALPAAAGPGRVGGARAGARRSGPGRGRATPCRGSGLAVIVPLVALLATSGLLAPEIDDGSISYLLAKPISRYTIVASKLVVAAACVVLFAALPDPGGRA